MPLCAFNRFVKGTQSRKYILRELIGGTMYPSFEYESNDFFELRCKGKTSEENFNKALDIKIIKPDTVTWENLNSAGEIEEYKYTHSNLGDTFVWVPVEFYER